MKNLIFSILTICSTVCSTAVTAKEILTNGTTMANAPDWLTATRVEKVTDHITSHIDISLKRVKVIFYFTEADYDKAQSFGAMSLAVTQYQGNDAVVKIGPQVTDKNFDEVFGHELVHVVVFQKYKDSVPKWLEEGLANHFARSQKIDYQWLAKQPFPEDVHQLAHPFRGSYQEVDYRYKASQAFAEMLAKKCDLEELLRISVTRNMEDYMHRTCEIKDLNVAFHDWVTKKAAGG